MLEVIFNMHEINRWEGEGGLVYDLTHRERIMKILKEAGIRFEEDPIGEEGTGNDIVIYPSNDERVYLSFQADGFLDGIDVYYP
jgi:hypothetical protein